MNLRAPFLASLSLTTVLFSLSIHATAEDSASKTNTPDAPTVHQGIINDYKAEKVAEHTYVIHGPLEQPTEKNEGFMNNPGFVITDKSVIVIDPGSSVQIGRAVLKHIRDLTDKPITHVFSSHVHGDHWLANQAIKEDSKDAKFYAHPTMIKKAKDGAAESWINVMDELSGGKTKGTVALIPDNALEDGQSITVDNITVKAHLNEWAHTKTDAMFQIVEDKILFTGDNTTSHRIARMDDGSFKGSIATLNKALELDVDHVVPGHGKTGDKSIISLFRDYLATVYDQTKVGMEDDLEAYEMKDGIMEKLEHYKNWSGIDQEIGKHISLSILEAEQEDF